MSVIFFFHECYHIFFKSVTGILLLNFPLLVFDYQLVSSKHVFMLEKFIFFMKILTKINRDRDLCSDILDHGNVVFCVRSNWNGTAVEQGDLRSREYPFPIISCRVKALQQVACANELALFRWAAKNRVNLYWKCLSTSRTRLNDSSTGVWVLYC